MARLVSNLKKTAMAALAASVVASGITTFSATSAEAQWRPRPGYGYGYGPRPYRANRGPAVAAGIIGGLAVGALIAGAARPAYAAPAYGQPVYGGGYGYAAPVYHGNGYGVPSSYVPAYDQGYGYQPTCYTRKVRQVVDYDTVVIRRVRVCE
jgi:hypothetical protein